jgi:hypothetical protein
MQDIRTVQLDEVQDNDEMEISDDDRDSYGPSTKRTKWDNDKLKVSYRLFLCRGSGINESRSKKLTKCSNLMKIHESRSKKRSKWSNLVKIHKSRSKKRSKLSNLMRIHESRSKKRSKLSNLMKIHESRSKERSK